MVDQSPPTTVSPPVTTTTTAPPTTVAPVASPPPVVPKAVFPTPDLIGSFDVATMAPGGTRVGGWALDPNTAQSVEVHVYVDGAFAGVLDADANRPDIATAFPGYGDSHGFDATIAVPSGFHTVCAYGMNYGPGSNSLIGCRWVLVNPDPIGSFDVASINNGALRVAGWALDPNAAQSVKVHLYVDGAFAGFIDADLNRLDIATTFPGYGESHGFDATLAVGPGSHLVCAYGINQGSGSNVVLGCRNA